MALGHPGLLQYRHGLYRCPPEQRDGERWGPRTLDLDILLYGMQKINEATLTVPHSGLYERAFVLYPLQEIAPELRFPDGQLLDEVVARCPAEGIQRLEGK